VQNALGQTTASNYDLNTGLLTSTTDPNNQTTTYAYDNMWRLTAAGFPDGGQTTFAYTSLAPFQVTVTSKITSTMNLVSTAVVDGLGRVKQTQLNSDPQGIVYADTTYDALGRQATLSNPYRSTTDPTYGVTTYQYDALNRVTKVIPPDGSSTTNNVATAYTGNCATVTDRAGKPLKSCSDGLGRLTQVFEPDAGGNFIYETDYQYDALDNLIRVDQKGNDPNSANWRTRTFTYNSLSRLLSATNPESGTTSYAYDANGSVTSRTDARNITTTYSYDALNRLTQKTYSDGTATSAFQYDSSVVYGLSLQNPLGRLVREQQGCSGAVYSYDAVGRVVSQWEWTPVNCGVGSYLTSASYDLAGNLTSLTYPSGRVVNYSYNNAQRLTQVTFSSWNGQAVNYNYLSSASYAPHGAPASLTLGSGLVETDSYNSRLQPGQMKISSSVLTAMNLSYNFYDASNRNDGNVLGITDNLAPGRTQTFTYDASNRLGSALTRAASGANCWGQSYGYDAWGNLLAENVTQCSAPMLSLSVNGNNRITNPGFSYDTAGNLLADGSYTYQYDAENRLATLSSTAATYTYDALGQRVRKQVGTGSTEYIYSPSAGLGGRVLAEHNVATGGWSDYIYAGSRLLVKADGFEDRIHIWGTNCSNCGWQWTRFGFPNAAGYYGYVIQPGDRIFLRQFQWNGARGGMYFDLSDGSAIEWAVYDQNGQFLNDMIGTGWEPRWADLSPWAGKAITGIYLIADGNTPAGAWNIWYNDIALVSADGTVRPIYTRQTTVSLQIYGTSGVTGVGYAVDHDPGVVGGSNFSDNMTNYYHGDQLGSARLMTSVDGYPVWSATYLPFGQEWNPQMTVNHYKFTGLERDAETALDHTWFRQYSSAQGRWLTPDPLGGSVLNPQLLNRYTYVLNSPTNLIDPLGLQEEGGPPELLCWWGGGGFSGIICELIFNSLFGGHRIIRSPTEPEDRRREKTAPPAPQQTVSRIKQVNQCAAQEANRLSIASVTGLGKVPVANILFSNNASSLSQLIFGPARGEGAVNLAVNATAPSALGASAKAARTVTVDQGFQFLFTSTPATTVAETAVGGTLVRSGSAAANFLNGVAFLQVPYDAAVYIGALVTCSVSPP